MDTGKQPKKQNQGKVWSGANPTRSLFNKRQVYKVMSMMQVWVEQLKRTQNSKQLLHSIEIKALPVKSSLTC